MSGRWVNVRRKALMIYKGYSVFIQKGFCDSFAGWTNQRILIVDKAFLKLTPREQAVVLDHEIAEREKTLLFGGALASFDGVHKAAHYAAERGQPDHLLPKLKRLLRARRKEIGGARKYHI